MIGVGDVQQIERLVGLDQRVDQLHRRRRIDVRVVLPDDEQQLSLQLARVLHVRALDILRPDRPTHPLLVPPHLVHPVVMTPGGRESDLVELGMKEESTEGVLATR